MRNLHERHELWLEMWRELWLDLLSLVWPTACVACGADDRDCCAACLSEVRCREPPRRFELDGPAFAAGSYAGALKAFLVAYKHAGRVGFVRDLGQRLRPALAAALSECQGPHAPVIVAAPSRPARVRQRGYRHVEDLIGVALKPPRRARNGSRERPWAVLRVRALRTLKGRTTQVGLDSKARAVNARRLAVRRSARRLLRGREVILIDDIATTGATLYAAKETLEAAGAQVRAVAVVCLAERRDLSEST